MQKAVPIPHQFSQHLRPAKPEHQPQQREDARKYQKDHARLQPHPEKRHQKSTPGYRSKQPSHHRLERRKTESFWVPVIIRIPNLTRMLFHLPPVFRSSKHATYAMTDERCPTEEEKTPNDPNHPIRRVFPV